MKPLITFGPTLPLQTLKKHAYSNLDIINIWEMPVNNSFLAHKDFLPLPAPFALPPNLTHGNMFSYTAANNTFMPSELNDIIKLYGNFVVFSHTPKSHVVLFSRMQAPSKITPLKIWSQHGFYHAPVLSTDVCAMLNYDLISYVSEDYHTTVHPPPIPIHTSPYNLLNSPIVMINFHKILLP
jgi:hypothetical protein